MKFLVCSYLRSPEGFSERRLAVALQKSEVPKMISWKRKSESGLPFGKTQTK